MDSWSSMVDPKDYFDGMNVSIHGVDEEDVRGAPDFKQASLAFVWVCPMPGTVRITSMSNAMPDNPRFPVLEFAQFADRDSKPDENRSMEHLPSTCIPFT